MKGKVISILLGSGIIVLAAATNIFGCLCADYSPNPPCRSYGRTPVIFTGTVLESDPIDFSISERKAKLTVRDIYKNVFSGLMEKELVIFSDPRCGPFFKVGEEYLVYAYGSPDHLETGMCSRTRLLKDATEDFVYFKGVPFLKNGGRIYGTVKKYASGYGDDEDFGLTRPMGNILVRIRSTKRPPTIMLRTDRNGKFEISNVSPGIYFVDPLLPKNLKFSVHTGTRPLDYFELNDKGCLELTYYVDFEGEIRGRILDQNGHGVGGAYAQIVSADSRFEGPDSTVHLLDWAISDANGNYRIRGIPPGRYYVGLGIGGDPSFYGKNGRIFYPNTIDSSQARIVTVIERRPLTDINLMVPKKK